MIKLGKWMLDKEECGQFINTEIRNTVEELQPIMKRMFGWQSRKYASMTGDLTAMLQDYLMGITLIDVAMFNHIMKMIHNKQDKFALVLYSKVQILRNHQFFYNQTRNEFHYQKVYMHRYMIF